MRALLTVTLVLSLAAIAGCGRKAPLDTPSQAAYERDREEAKKAGLPPPAKPSGEVPDRPFILDGLID